MAQKTSQNFCGLQKEFSSLKDSAIAILPVAFDKTSSWIKGSAKGPKAMIEASQHLELYDIETDSNVCERGIFTQKQIAEKSSEKMIQKVFEQASALLKKKKFVVTLGGEHTVCIGAIRAHALAFNELSVLHLDAHADRRDSYEGKKLTHADTIARVQEAVENIISVGIRSMDSSEAEHLDKSKVFFAHEIMSSDNWMQEAVEKLSQNVYVTIDLDVFDPGIMPSTGTPEPGGLNWYQVTGLLKKVVENKNIVGFDVVELCPSQHNKAPDFLAAKLVLQTLSYIFTKKR